MSRIVLALSALSMTACAPTPVLIHPPPPTPPDWMSLSGRIDPDETPDCAKSGFGVGGASGIKNKSLLRQAARTAARSDLSKRLSACWAKRLEGKFPHRSEISPEESKVSYETALNQIVSTAVDAAQVVHAWQPDAESEYFYLEVKPGALKPQTRE